MSQERSISSPRPDWATPALDESFGIDGFVGVPSPTNPNVYTTLFSTTIEPTETNQRFFVNSGYRNKAYVSRFLPDGIIDTTFGEQGYAQIPHLEGFSHEGLRAFNYFFDKTGSFICTGIVLTNDNNIAAATRIMETGEIDKSFGSNGIMLYPLPESDGATPADNQTGGKQGSSRRNLAEGVEQILNAGSPDTVQGSRQSDGKIILMHQHHLLRINKNGSLDNTFGINGFLKIEDLRPRPAAPIKRLNLWNFTIDRENSITVVGSGSIWDAGPFDGVAFRYDSSGNFDNSFGDSGVLQVPGTDELFQFRGVHAFDDGTVLIAAAQFISGDATRHQDMKVLKLIRNGQPDPDFNNGEPLTIDLTPHSFIGSNILIDDGQRIVITGEESVVVPELYSTGAMIRCTPRGQMDSGFGLEGVALYKDLGSFFYRPSIQSGKNILVVTQDLTTRESKIVRFLG